MQFKFEPITRSNSLAKQLQDTYKMTPGEASTISYEFGNNGGVNDFNTWTKDTGLNTYNPSRSGLGASMSESKFEPITATNYDPSMMTASPDGKGMIHTETGQFVPNEAIAAFSKPKEVWGGMTGSELAAGGLQVAGLANSFIQGERNRKLMEDQLDMYRDQMAMTAADIGYDKSTGTTNKRRTQSAVGAAFA